MKSFGDDLPNITKEHLDRQLDTTVDIQLNLAQLHWLFKIWIATNGLLLTLVVCGLAYLILR